MENKNNKKLNKKIISQNNQDDVLELIYKIIENGKIINLKERILPAIDHNYDKIEPIILQDNAITLNKINNNKINEEILELDKDMKINSKIEKNEQYEDLTQSEEYQSYLNFKKNIANIGLKKLIDKVNTPDINHKISIYTHENALLSQAILINIVFLMKPIFLMGVNLVKENLDDGEIKLQIIKNYLEDNLKDISFQAIKLYMSYKFGKEITLKQEEKYVTDDYDEITSIKFKQNIQYFNNAIVNNLLMWLNLSFENSRLYKRNNNETLEVQLEEYIKQFFDSNLSEILEKITF